MPTPQETLQDLRLRVADIGALLNLSEKKARIIELEAGMELPDFWNNQERAVATSQELARIKEEVQAWEAISGDIEALEGLFRDVKDEDLSLTDELERLMKRYQSLETAAFFTGAYDREPAIVAIHAGTGGVDAMDWAEILMRMYLRFCESMKWKVLILDEQRGGEAGIKTVSFEVKGPCAYGYLKAEHGVHRLVRISPFDAEKMRHTSFALVEVVPDMGPLGTIEIRPEEVRIDVFRAGGHGGQSVNTTDSAVRITHLPTGIVVSCQNERSQVQNKESAFRYLRAKLAKLQEEERLLEKKEARGAHVQGSWGNQVRSYVLNPYRLVKDHRTGYETQDVTAVLDGDVLPFIESYLLTFSHRLKK